LPHPAEMRVCFSIDLLLRCLLHLRTEKA